MSTPRQRIFVLAGCLLLTTAACKSQTTTPVTSTGHVAAPDGKGGKAAPKEVAFTGDIGWKTAVEPKDLSNNVQKGLSWLISHQLENGGWGQGDEAPGMRASAQKSIIGKANVADTAMALMVLMRSGSTPSEGPYKDAINKGFAFILSEIEESDDDSLYVTKIRGTRVQSKIGTYVDTFNALIVLTEAQGKMPDDEANQRMEKALAKVLNKVEKNQRHDGTWDNRGWAPVLTQSMAAKGLNRAAQAGADVDEATLVRVEEQAQKQFDAKRGSFSSGGSANVQLYSGAANSSSLRDSVNTRNYRAQVMVKKAEATPTEANKAAAQRELAGAQKATIATESAEKALIRRLKDPAFIRGFGNNGGEEFLSYMLVSESLVVNDGDDWKEWDANITKLVNGVQNEDGSWTGHHCITGRTFCTAAALMVLMADRTPVPTAAQIKGR